MGLDAMGPDAMGPEAMGPEAMSPDSEEDDMYGAMLSDSMGGGGKGERVQRDLATTDVRFFG